MTAWMPQINTAKCTGCKGCVTVCPTQAIAQRDGKAFLQSPQACTYCTACEDVCPVGAIALPLLIMKREPQKDMQ